MNTKIILLFGSIMLLFSSCVDYLDPYPNGDISDKELWDYQVRVQGLVGQCYEYMSRNYNDNEGAYLDGATDDAVITSSTQAMKRLATRFTINKPGPIRVLLGSRFQSNKTCKYILERPAGI